MPAPVSPISVICSRVFSTSLLSLGKCSSMTNVNAYVQLQFILDLVSPCRLDRGRFGTVEVDRVEGVSTE